MSAFFEYFRNITYYLLFATIVGIFAPVGKYRKFVSLVMGFALLLLMLAPLTRFGSGMPINQLFGELIPGMWDDESPDWESGYAQWRDEYFRQIFEAQLETQLRGLLTEEGFTLHSAAFEYSSDFTRLTSVRVSVGRVTAGEAERVPFIRIVPPQISPIEIGRVPEEPADCPVATEVKILISQFYNLPKSHIDVEVRDL